MSAKLCEPVISQRPGERSASMRSLI
jgi:hypothetical protein